MKKKISNKNTTHKLLQSPKEKKREREKKYNIFFLQE